jgi:hypothetical protein
LPAVKFRTLGQTGIQVSAYCLGAPRRHRAGHEGALLAGATLTLDDKTLDRIDEIVPPDTNVCDPNEYAKPPTLTDPTLRRRPPARRAAA